MSRQVLRLTVVDVPGRKVISRDKGGNCQKHSAGADAKIIESEESNQVQFEGKYQIGQEFVYKFSRIIEEHLPVNQVEQSTEDYGQKVEDNYEAQCINMEK